MASVQVAGWPVAAIKAPVLISQHSDYQCGYTTSAIQRIYPIRPGRERHFEWKSNHVSLSVFVSSFSFWRKKRPSLLEYTVGRLVGKEIDGMTSRDTVKRAEQLVEGAMKGNDASHDASHVWRVRDLALSLAREEGLSSNPDSMEIVN